MVFLQKFDPTGKEPTQSEGYCLICAKQLGIGPVSDMLEKMGIDDDQLEIPVGLLHYGADGFFNGFLHIVNRYRNGNARLHGRSLPDDVMPIL